MFTAPANCAEGTGWMLISGDLARHQALQGALQAMTGKVIYGAAPMVGCADANPRASFRRYGQM